MTVTITAAGLVAAYPEWESANTNTPNVVANAVARANALPLELYTDTSEETDRRYLEAGAMLYDHPYGRDMHKPDQAALNPYRKAADRRDILKGTAYRVPNWDMPSGIS